MHLSLNGTSTFKHNHSFLLKTFSELNCILKGCYLLKREHIISETISNSNPNINMFSLPHKIHTSFLHMNKYSMWGWESLLLTQKQVLQHWEPQPVFCEATSPSWHDVWLMYSKKPVTSGCQHSADWTGFQDQKAPQALWGKVLQSNG